eukprot:jgi/Tetstr1/428295/TSEL_001828.t1
MGALARLVLPPTRTLALVEYLEAQDASAAFRGLAYKRCATMCRCTWSGSRGHLRTRRADGYKSQTVAEGGRKRTTSPDEAAAVHDSTVVAGLVDAENDAAGAEGVRARALREEPSTSKRATLLCGRTSPQRHGEPVRQAGVCTAARVATKPAPASKTGEESQGVLSLGFGFVELDSEATARARAARSAGVQAGWALSVLQLARCRRRLGATRRKDVQERPRREPVNQRLMVRNVAFETTRKELSSLFGAVGQLKSLRLPKKFDAPTAALRL